HTAVNDPWAQVSDCLAVAKGFPSVRFNLAHSCRFHLPLLRECAATKNVWVDCSAHLAHCQLARENRGAVAPADQRVAAEYTKPAKVLEAVHAILGDKYLSGSDNPFMRWYDEPLRIPYPYQDEMGVTNPLPAAKPRRGSPTARVSLYVFVAYPALDPWRRGHLAQHARTHTLRIGIDSPEAADLIGEAAGRAGSTIGVLVDLDVGHHRTGTQ